MRIRGGRNGGVATVAEVLEGDAGGDKASVGFFGGGFEAACFVGLLVLTIVSTQVWLPPKLHKKFLSQEPPNYPLNNSNIPPSIPK